MAPSTRHDGEEKDVETHHAKSEQESVEIDRAARGAVECEMEWGRCDHVRNLAVNVQAQRDR
eukprot:CAMPEP_0113924908 /NCGR_PEP_ID=MMETSP1159-20121227/2919_1 /TAXON_ID=88271 /ORGANISM="Picocystis salinarum" /LENGTH=61 /DNA_ID=CAMNT_0000925159 /DNA_START=1 /DNA_END=187 /DNA_ORIENTATION=+ /assembly_acc=CAM_ASM_000767